MKTLKELIQRIETRTGKKFDLNNRRDFLRLNTLIERLHKDELRKLSLIEKVLKSDDYSNDLYNNRSHYLQKRYKD